MEICLFNMTDGELNRQVKKTLMAGKHVDYLAIAAKFPDGYVKREGHNLLFWCWESKAKWAWPEGLELVRQGADLNRPSGRGTKLLLFRCLQDPSPASRLQDILALGARVDVKDEFGFPPLYKAASRIEESMACVDLLLQAGADPNAVTDQGEVALCAASSVEVAQKLVKAGVDIHHVTGNGCTPLMSAAYYGRADLVEFLLSIGARVSDVDHDNEDALHHTIAGGEQHLAVVNALLAAGADVEFRNRFGLNAIAAAQDNGQYDIAELLIAWRQAQVASQAINGVNRSYPVAPL